MTEKREIEVLYEDNHLIAVNKRSGDISQGDKTGDAPLGEAVKEYLKKKYNKPGDVFLGVIHRIDRPTTGVLLFAKTSKALERMNRLFQERAVQKEYWAVTGVKPKREDDSLVHYLKKNQAKNKSNASDREATDRKRAELDYFLLAKSDRYYLLKVLPKTGRHHQIRVQLAKIGCPIKGDLKYGAKRANKDRSIHLHARSLEFVHPTKKELFKITAKSPDDPVWNAFDQMVTNVNHR